MDVESSTPIEETVEDLDKRYGVAIPPKYWSNIEKFKKPASLQLLDPTTAPVLQAYLTTATDGLEITRTNHQTIILLWLMDEEGQIWFCVEEAFKDDAEISVYPRLDGVKYPDGYEKLGHPSLILAAKARIGGELIWDIPEDSEPRWMITNKSGRYGIREDIFPQHIDNIAKKFEDLGVKLKPHHIIKRN